MARRCGTVAVLGLAWLVFGAVGSVGCSGSTVPAADARPFDPERLLEVRIEMAPADWQALRMEHRDLLAEMGPGRFDRPAANPYHTYPAEVSMDGQRLGQVGLRKRGFIGSSSFQRPSLGLRLDEFNATNRFHGLKRLSLNNNLQDPSRMHQVLAYRVFAQAGVPASRCQLARVVVNGQSLGIYSHVEPVNTAFLQRRFGDAGGHLYEGQLSDFRPEWVDTFERKNNEDQPSRSDLAAVVRALEGDHEQLLARVEAVVDLEAYLTFWAVETLLGHWDSYSNNGNNFFVYRRPATGKFTFIPWGVDSVFGDADPFTPFTQPESVMARSLLPYRLYQLPASRERYRERLRHLLNTVWRERDLLAEVDRLERLIQKEVMIKTAYFQAGIVQVRQFIRTRRAALQRELDGPAPTWDLPLRGRPCLTKIGTITAAFGTLREEAWPVNPLVNGDVRFTVEGPGGPREYAAVGVVAVPARDARNDGCPTLSVVAMPKGTVKLHIVALVIQPEFYTAKTAIPVDGFSVGGVLLEGNLLGGKFTIGGLPLGTLKLEEAGAKPGDPVRGTLQADLYQIPQ